VFSGYRFTVVRHSQRERKREREEEREREGDREEERDVHIIISGCKQCEGQGEMKRDLSLPHPRRSTSFSSPSLTDRSPFTS
jgi:hypothetical protein